VQKCVDDTLSIVGKNVVLGLPIGVGKPTIIANEFYRRAKNDSSISLVIYSGLTLHTPMWKTDMERRMIEPICERLFPDYPNPVYFADAMAKKLPDNVNLREIYLSPGSGIGNPHFQQEYLSSNYTHVARDVSAGGCNVVAAILSERSESGTYSMGSNADAAILMAWDLINKRRSGEKVCILGQVNPNMPYMYGAGEVSESDFTGIVNSNNYSHGLFAAPKEPITIFEYAIGLHVSTLIKDGGTFQVGFGSLADAVTYSMLLRHNNNSTYRDIIDKAGIYKRFGTEIDNMGGLGTFDQGLYGCSEFIYDGFLRLMQGDVIKKNVYEDLDLQRLLNDKKISEKVDEKTYETLVEEGIISDPITEKDFHYLKKYGIVKNSIGYRDGSLTFDKMESVPPGLTEEEYRKWIISHCSGDRLKQGIQIHAGFFIGSKNFYDQLSELDDETKKKIKMREISFVNDVAGDNELKIQQRKDGRFVNTAMMVTMMGGVVSDTLDNGQVVSGVGGQFNFVYMGHALPDARSILILRSTRENGKEDSSNLVWTSGNLTIPRHLRDVFVTEYGIADVRGKTDKQTIINLLNITDSRFQGELLKKAKENRKVPENYRIPEAFKHNFPGAIEKNSKTYKKDGLFEIFPYGKEFTDEEIVLSKALKGIKKKISNKSFGISDIKGIPSVLNPPVEAMPYLERMKLDNPSGRNEKMQQKIVLFALMADKVI